MDWMSYISAAPEIVLLGLICIVLVADLFVSNERRILTYWMALASLVITLVVLLATAPEVRTTVFSGSYVSDGLSQVLKISVTGFVAVAFIYARDYLRVNDLHKGEFYTLGLFGLLGMMIMASANSLLTMYLGLETLALSQYALVAFDRNNETSAESAMKYFVLGAIASGALLYGISWVYGVTGSIQFNEIAAALISDPAMNSLPLWFGVAFIVVGIAFKFGAVPFHMWLPDVYHGARSPVTLYVASAPKVAAFALTIRILVDALGDLHDVWSGMIMVIAVLSLLLGNIVAIAQTNIKRMLAYSTIAHVGFILLDPPEPQGVRGGVPEGFQRSECAEPMVRAHDDVPDDEHGRHPAVHRFLRQAECDQRGTGQWLHGPRDPDDAGLGARPVLLPEGGLVHVLRGAGRPGGAAGQHGYAPGHEPERCRGAGARDRAGLALGALPNRPRRIGCRRSTPRRAIETGRSGSRSVTQRAMFRHILRWESGARRPAPFLDEIPNFIALIINII
jgi:hypothetical protein